MLPIVSNHWNTDCVLLKNQLSYKVVGKTTNIFGENDSNIEGSYYGENKLGFPDVILFENGVSQFTIIHCTILLPLLSTYVMWYFKNVCEYSFSNTAATTGLKSCKECSSLWPCFSGVKVVTFIYLVLDLVIGFYICHFLGCHTRITDAMIICGVTSALFWDVKCKCSFPGVAYQGTWFRRKKTSFWIFQETLQRKTFFMNLLCRKLRPSTYTCPLWLFKQKTNPQWMNLLTIWCTTN